MAFMKGDLGGGLDSPDFLSALLSKTPKGIDGNPLFGSPDPFANLDAQRNAQRNALANYMAKVTSPAPKKPVGMDNDHKRGLLGRADMKPGHYANLGKAPLDAIPDYQNMMAGPKSLSDEEIQAQAGALFKPQFDYLAGLEDAANQRFKASDSEVAKIYAALQQSYKQDAPNVGGIYDATAAGMTGAYDEGVQNIAKAQDDTAARTAAVMKKLGIQQAGPELFKENVADAQAAQQRLRSQQAVDLAGNASSKGAALNDLVVKGQAAGLEGADQRSALRYQLADILAGYGMKRADLSSKEAQAAMDIRSNEAKQQQDYFDSLMKQQQQQFDNELKLGQYDLSRDQFDWQEQQAIDKATAGPDMKSLSPMEQVYAAAAQAYGNPQASSNGVKAVTDAARLFQQAKGRPAASAQDLINYLRERNPNANDLRILMDLATRYWDATN